MKQLALFAVLAAALAGVTVSAQSLGELARQEEARRKAIASSGKVYTNDSVKRDPSDRPATPPAQPATAPDGQPAPAADDAADAAAPEAAKTEEPKRDETYWRTRMEAARLALSRAQIFGDALQSRINGLTSDFAARDDPAQRAIIARDRERALAELERVKQEIQQFTKAITDIQDEARRAGVPPGWLR